MSLAELSFTLCQAELLRGGSAPVVPMAGMPFLSISFAQYLQHLDGDVSDPSQGGISSVLMSVIRPKPHYIKSLCLISPGSSELLENRDLILLHACTVPCPAFLPPGRYFIHVREWPLSLWIRKLFLKREKCATHRHLTSRRATIIACHDPEHISVLSGASLCLGKLACGLLEIHK